MEYHSECFLNRKSKSFPFLQVQIQGKSALKQFYYLEVHFDTLPPISYNPHPINEENCKVSYTYFMTVVATEY